MYVHLEDDYVCIRCMCAAVITATISVTHIFKTYTSSNFLRLFRPFPPLASPIPPRSPPASVRQTHNACCGRLKSGHSSLAMPCHMLQRHNIPIAPTYCGRLDFGRRNLPAAPAVRAAGARSRPKALAPRDSGCCGQITIPSPTSFGRVVMVGGPVWDC